MKWIIFIHWRQQGTEAPMTSSKQVVMTQVQLGMAVQDTLFIPTPILHLPHQNKRLPEIQILVWIFLNFKWEQLIL